MNMYLESIKLISNDTKYAKWYISIIKNGILRSSDKRTAKETLGYCEKHHIIPKCFFNEQMEILENLSSENIDNFVYLTAKEHFVCHWLLIKMIDGKMKYKMRNALHRMSKSSGGRIISSFEYDIARKHHSINMIENNPSKNENTLEKTRKTWNNNWGGHPLHSPEIRKQIDENWKEVWGGSSFKVRIG